MGSPSRPPGLPWKMAKPPASRLSRISRLSVSRFRSTFTSAGAFRARHHQNIRGFGEVAGGRRDDGFRSDVDFAVLAYGRAHVGLGNEVDNRQLGTGIGR